MRRRPSKMLFHGFRVVVLPDNFVREALRVWAEGRLLAVVQKNGNIGLHGTGLFDDPNNVHAMHRAAKCLHGLKLVGDEFLAAHRERVEESGRKSVIARLKDEADELGFKLVAK